MKSQEEIELQFRNPETPNYPGYSHRLEFHPLKRDDAFLLAPTFRSSAKSIRSYLSGFQYADRWSLKDCRAFVDSCLRDDFPTMHYVFTIGNNPVAFASLYPIGDRLDEVQIVLAVFGKHQGKGIGKSVAVTLKNIAFQVWGFRSLWWIVDATNRSSMKVADSIGCLWESSFEEPTKSGESGSGLWHRYVIDRDPNLAPGILQGASVDYWHMPKDAGMLKAVIKSRDSHSSQINQQINAVD